MSKCSRCKQLKEDNKFGKNKSRKTGLQDQCKECRSETKSNKTYQAKYRKSHKQAQKMYQSKYYADNGDSLRLKANERYRINPEPKIAYQCRYIKNRRKYNILFRIGSNLRRRIGLAFQGKNKSKSTIDILGCSVEDAKSYLQGLFQLGMTWDNYRDWEIDHIQPLAMANNEAELIKLCHYTNLQPLWFKDHSLKTIEDIKKIKANKINKL